MKSFTVCAGVAALCALMLSACVDSASPILPDSHPLLGPHLRLQLYTVRQGHAREPEKANYNWNGKLYALAGGGTHDVAAFSVHPFEAGDHIIQSVPANKAQKTEYALLHKLAEGVYLVVAIDEDDADAATRAAHCKHPGGAGCRIETREELFTFARATAAKRHTDGGLAIRLEEPPERRSKRPLRQR